MNRSQWVVVRLLSRLDDVVVVARFEQTTCSLKLFLVSFHSIVWIGCCCLPSHLNPFPILIIINIGRSSSSQSVVLSFFFSLHASSLSSLEGDSFWEEIIRQNIRHTYMNGHYNLFFFFSSLALLLLVVVVVFFRPFLLIKMYNLRSAS